uniref:Predicted protein n=1 Tax=Hordeum vulgare subsp. vulgare TaxID=112509 RepID=F2CTE2_HORVV|nr:predicted protein [Hordeum vulgare subsp. vulgare]
MAVVAGVEGKPLRLKDLLELDCDSCSAAGFRCYPRHLCAPAAAPLRAPHDAVHEAAEAPRGLGRSPSLRHPLLSIRSLSRRLRDGFSWRRRDEENAAAPVPAASSSSSSSVSDSESSESGSSTERKSESDFSASSTESLHAGAATAGTACKREEDKEAMDRESKEADDKEQLSPVAVMDFPFDDDDDDCGDDPVEEEEEEGSACSTSFSDSLAQLHQRRNIQMHYKIRRRCGSIGEVGAVDLDESFAASDHDDPGSVPVRQPECFCSDDGAATTPSLPDGHWSVDACQDPRRQNLLPLQTDAVSERLLLDFFAETRKNGTSENFEAAARMAEGWIQGTGARWGLKEVLCGREHLLAEMDRSQRWSARLGEVEEVGVVVAGLLIDELVADLLTDLLL